MKRFAILICITFIVGAIQLNAQGFQPYIAIGANITDDYLTELGNSQVGTRMGLITGLGVAGRINRRWETSVELLYSQNGYYLEFSQIPTVALDKIVAHYIEVPLALVYRFGGKKRKEEYLNKPSISGGLSYAHLFKYKVIAVDGRNLTNDIRFDQENALLFTIAATSFFSESLALNGRGTLSTFGEMTIALRLLYYISKE